MMDITEDDFNSWKHHPVSKVFLHFLKDREQMLLRDIALRIASTQTSPDLFYLGKLSGRAEEALEHANTEFAHIASFYTPPEQEEQQEKED